jgi:NADH dehydrogenase
MSRLSIQAQPAPDRSWPRVFVIGGGFGGLECAKHLKGVPVQVTLVDRRNHHVFQPLLYQVATAALSPAQIAAPIRAVVRHVRNCRVVLAEITGVDPARKRLIFDGGEVEYDYLVLAAGATHSYFGHPEFAKYAPGLKTLEDATEIRKRILLAFENAEYEGDEAEIRKALTFGIVGGGPTGVELAGAIKEIAAKSIPEDFRHIDTTSTRVILFQGGDRVLPQFPPELSERAKRDLEEMGVEVRLNTRVDEVTKDGVRLGAEFIPLDNVFWAAGVQANPIGRSLGVPTDRAGCVIVNSDCSVPGYPNVFVIGDMAHFNDDAGQQLPGVAQVALQMGKHVAKVIAAEVNGDLKPDDDRPAFVYNDKGTMATIGKARAVALVKGWKITGLLAWLMWAVVHVAFLINFRNRLAVLANWAFNWLLNSRDARLITGSARLSIDKPRPGEVILAREGEGPAAAGAGATGPTPKPVAG